MSAPDDPAVVQPAVPPVTLPLPPVAAPVALAVDLRILQANERTLLAWIRTGLTLITFGFVVARLSLWLRLELHAEDGGISLFFGTAVIGLGAICQVLGARRFVVARRALLAGQPIVPGSRGPVAIALIVAAVGIALTIYLLAS